MKPAGAVSMVVVSGNPSNPICANGKNQCKFQDSHDLSFQLCSSSNFKQFSTCGQASSQNKVINQPTCLVHRADSDTDLGG